jgi:HAE1 family hydrophobic/amphiphilic exporter-1
MYKFFINRPIVAMVVAIITVIVGLVTLLASRSLSSQNHRENFIQANYVGADAQTIGSGRHTH